MGDRLHAVLCAAGYNVRWLMRMMAKKGLRALLWLLPAHVRRSIENVLAEVTAQKALQNAQLLARVAPG